MICWLLMIANTLLKILSTTNMLSSKRKYRLSSRSSFLLTWICMIRTHPPRYKLSFLCFYWTLSSTIFKDFFFITTKRIRFGRKTHISCMYLFLFVSMTKLIWSCRVINGLRSNTSISNTCITIFRLKDMFIFLFFHPISSTEYTIPIFSIS